MQAVPKVHDLASYIDQRACSNPSLLFHRMPVAGNAQGGERKKRTRGGRERETEREKETERKRARGG